MTAPGRRPREARTRRAKVHAMNAEQIEPMVAYEEVENGAIAIVTLDRPDARNAQNKQMTYELNDAFTRAANTDSVKCIVLAASGPHFSAGHDLKGPGDFEADRVWVGGPTDRGGAEGLMAFEEEMYLHMCRRWHDIPKPTIAAVSYTHLTLPTMLAQCRSRWSPYH